MTAYSPPPALAATWSSLCLPPTSSRRARQRALALDAVMPRLGWRGGREGAGAPAALTHRVDPAQRQCASSSPAHATARSLPDTARRRLPRRDPHGALLDLPAAPGDIVHHAERRGAPEAVVRRLRLWPPPGGGARVEPRGALALPARADASSLDVLPLRPEQSPAVPRGGAAARRIRGGPGPRNAPASATSRHRNLRRARRPGGRRPPPPCRASSRAIHWLRADGEAAPTATAVEAIRLPRARSADTVERPAPTAGVSLLADAQRGRRATLFSGE
jgi:hypothetical protein